MGYTVSSHRGDRGDRRRRGAGKTPGHTAISQAHVASTDFFDGKMMVRTGSRTGYGSKLGTPTIGWLILN